MCFSSSESIILPIRKINSKFFSQRCLFHLSQVAFVFPYWCEVLIKYPFIDVKSLHHFQSMFLPGGSHEDALQFQVHHSSFYFSSGGFNSSFVNHILFSFQMFSHAGAPLNHSLLDITSFSSVEDISEDSCFHSLSVQVILRLLSHSSHLIQPVQSRLSINHFQRCFLLSGP